MVGDLPQSLGNLTLQAWTLEVQLGPARFLVHTPERNGKTRTHANDRALALGIQFRRGGATGEVHDGGDAAP